MPNHKTHDTIGFITAPIVAGGAALVATQVGHNPIAAAGAMGVCHVAATWFLSPDLDLDSAIDDRWGPLAWVWTPYRVVVSHRSWVSHSLVGGLLRLVYIVIPVLAVLLIVQGYIQGFRNTQDFLNFFDVFWGTVWDYLVSIADMTAIRYALAGVITADLHHIVADAILTESKATARRILPRWLYRVLIR
jgi:uncharacterized metal-binding protein